MRDRMASAESALVMSLQAVNNHHHFNSPYLSASADNKNYFNGGGSAAVSVGKYNFLEQSSASAPDQDMSAASSS